MGTNPFRPSFGTSPPWLAGRDELLALFADGLDEGPGAPARALLLTGQRGMGKTVLLNGVEDLARTRGWVTLSETGHRGLVDRLLADHLAVELREREPSVASLTGVGAPLGVSLQWEHERRRGRPTGLRAELSRLADLCAEYGTGVLVTVDEVHAADPDELREVTTVVQHCFREEREVAFVAAGLPGAVSARLLDDQVLTFLRRAERWELEAVARHDVRQAIAVPVRRAGREIGSDALDRAVEATAGYPFLIQLVGYHAFRQEADAPVITVGHVEAALPAVRERLGRLVIAPALARLSDRDLQFLHAMAVDDATSKVRDIAARMEVDGNYANQYRRRLLAAELIQETGRGRVDLRLPGLREYLRRSSPTDVTPPQLSE